MRQTVGILHPGEMGVSVAASAGKSGCAVYWAAEARSQKTRERAETHGLAETSTLAKLCGATPAQGSPDCFVAGSSVRGVLMHTPVNDKPLDLAEFEPIYQKMSEYDLPILVHPLRSPEFADYRTESRSKFRIAQTIGWPYETACMMLRLTFSGRLQKYPNLKILAHHGGGFIPFLEKRIVGGYDSAEMRRKEPRKLGLTRPPVEYLERFYFDTALHGHVPALMCTYAF